MKKILCYGDSNTFGFNPENQARYDADTRWSGILKNHFKKEFEVKEEGLCDRNGFVNHPNGFLYSAQRHFPKLIAKIDDIAYTILAVGTNDLQFRYDTSMKSIELGLEYLIRIAQEKSQNVIVLAPVLLPDEVKKGNFAYQFDDSSILKSRKALKVYKRLSQILHYQYIDINKITKPSEIDGLHYDIESHRQIAQALIKSIEEQINNENTK